MRDPRALLPSALVLAALAATALLSGCLAGSGDPITMKDGLADARKAAAAWGDHPKLAAAAAIEPFKHAEDRDEDGKLEGEYVTHLDGNTGDGRAPGWLYMFAADDGRCVTIAYASGLGVLAEGWEDCRTDADDADDDVPQETQGLPDDLLDSDTVAHKLAGLEGWPEADDDTTMTWVLAGDDGQAAWLVSSSNSTSQVAAVVDAVTGEAALAPDGAFDVFGAEIDAAGDGDGTLQTTEADNSAPLLTAATPLEVSLSAGPDATLDVVSSFQTSLVGTPTVTVEGPGGDQVASQPAGEAIHLEHLSPGVYVVRMETMNAALQPSLAAQAAWFA